ncbi:HIT family protein [uncultured Cohaesibacter sp.]|uniref:HIT family protein n=1 Tax=uncultured Cohaesibacter sp. TaxID=1002546 RepID=UPI00292E6B79|nr:HIT family protein [uncultured Cohaesibacter sp.]
MTTPQYDDQNIFAKILRGEIPCHKIYEDDKTFAFLDVMPKADGHSLVLPKNPSRNILDVAEDDLNAVTATTQKIAKAIMIAFEADGVTVQQNNEPAGGQEVYHLHFHVLPRHEGLPLRPQTGKMADNDLLAGHAEKLREALKSI